MKKQTDKDEVDQIWQLDQCFKLILCTNNLDKICSRVGQESNNLEWSLISPNKNVQNQK